MVDQVIDILLVEDSVDDSAFVEHALEEAKLGAHLRIARDGVEALALLFRERNSEDAVPVIRPKLILLDLKLPRIDGLELLRRLKANPNTRSIPMVVLSSSQEMRDLAESYQLGVNSYLVKPMDFDDFGKTVEMLGRYWLQFNQLPKT
jgi:two-component system, response regulator